MDERLKHLGESKAGISRFKFQAGSSEVLGKGGELIRDRTIILEIPNTFIPGAR